LQVNGAGRFAGDLHFTPLTYLGTLIDTKGNMLEFRELNDTYGPLNFKLMNRDYFNGMFIEQEAGLGNAAAGVIDMGMIIHSGYSGGSLDMQGNVRLDSRQGYIMSGNNYEWQIGAPYRSPQWLLRLGDVYSYLDTELWTNHNLSIGSSRGTKIFNIITGTNAEMVHYENTTYGQPTTFEIYANNGAMRGYFGLVPGSWQGLTDAMIFQATGAVGIGSGLNNLVASFSATGNEFKTSFTLPYVAKTGTYTITDTDFTIDCTSNTFTVTLPTAVGRKGKIYEIKNSGTGTITLATTSSQTIDGATTKSLAQYNSYTVQSNNANWIIISKV